MDDDRHPFERHLAAVADTIEAQLATWLDDTVGTGETARPPRLMAAMRHAALGGGKRMRPFLTVEAARLVGGQEAAERAIHAGCAIECLHGYSLVHDDLPSMDDDDLRRGRPTVHRAYDEATAILAGDALLTLAFEKLASEDCHPDPALRITLVAGLARAGGLGGMVGGQMLDLAAEGRFGDPAPALEATRRLQAMKTGALIAFSAEAGALVGGADGAERAALRIYGETLGATFQIADDILDRQATTEELGKATAKDAAKGKATLIDLMGMDAAVKERDRLVGEAIRALARFGAEANTLRQAAVFAAERRT